MYTMVRFFSLLFCLFLLERGAKREKQPPLPNYFYFRCCSNYCTWKVFFALVLWWSQFEYEKNRIPWKKTFRILSLSQSLLFRTKKRSLPSCASFFRFFRESFWEELQRSDAFIVVVVVIRSIIISTTTEEHQTPPPRGKEKKSEFLSRFLLLFFSGSVSLCLLFFVCFFSFASFVRSRLALSSHFFCSWEHTPQ